MFLLVAFLLGGYVYSAMDLKQVISQLEGLEVQQDNNFQSSVPVTPEGCPDLLIQRGQLLHLYDTKMPIINGVNPVIFNSLEEYSIYYNSQKSLGKNCPILFLQQENNAQGNDIYRIRPSPFNPFAGVPSNSPLVQSYDGIVIEEADASRDNGYNTNMYPGFDPDNLYIGRITETDIVHASTENAEISDNPMDSNWGGVLYTQGQVDSGKYIENEVTKPNYVTPKGAQMLPIYGHPRPYP